MSAVAYLASDSSFASPQAQTMLAALPSLLPVLGVGSFSTADAAGLERALVRHLDLEDVGISESSDIPEGVAAVIACWNGDIESIAAESLVQAVSRGIRAVVFLPSGDSTDVVSEQELAELFGYHLPPVWVAAEGMQVGPVITGLGHLELASHSASSASV